MRLAQARGGSVVQHLGFTSVSVTSPGSAGARAAGPVSNVGGAGVSVNGVTVNVVVSGSVSCADSGVGGVVGDRCHANLTATNVSFGVSVAGTRH